MTITPTIQKTQNDAALTGCTTTLDRDLRVTDAFGLRTADSFRPTGEDAAEALPVPATWLLDENGKILWLEFADSYQLRSGPEVVLAAIESHLDKRS